jgi:hypothetical protein
LFSLHPFSLIVATWAISFFSWIKEYINIKRYQLQQRNNPMTVRIHLAKKEKRNKKKFRYNIGPFLVGQLLPFFSRKWLKG